MSGIKVKNMQAGDPGVGFNLDLSRLEYGSEVGKLDQSKHLEIVMDIYEPNSGGGYPDMPTTRSAMTIGQPIDKAEEMVIVLPFGSASYTHDNIKVNLTIRQNNDALLINSYTGKNDIVLSPSDGKVQLAANPTKVFNFDLVDI